MGKDFQSAVASTFSHEPSRVARFYFLLKTLPAQLLLLASKRDFKESGTAEPNQPNYAPSASAFKAPPIAHPTARARARRSSLCHLIERQREERALSRAAARFRGDRGGGKTL